LIIQSGQIGREEHTSSLLHWRIIHWDRRRQIVFERRLHLQCEGVHSLDQRRNCLNRTGRDVLSQLCGDREDLLRDLLFQVLPALGVGLWRGVLRTVDERIETRGGVSLFICSEQAPLVRVRGGRRDERRGRHGGFGPTRTGVGEVWRSLRRVDEGTGQVSFSSFLQSQDCRALEARVRLGMVGDITDQLLKMDRRWWSREVSPMVTITARDLYRLTCSTMEEKIGGRDPRGRREGRH
jgi:hypothetical protein